AKLTSKKASENVDPQEGSNPSGVPPKSTSASEKPRTAESAHFTSGDSLNDVSSSSEGYSLSPSPNSAEKANSFLEEIDKALGNQVKQLNSPLKEKYLIREDQPTTPNVPIQPGLNKGIQIDPRIQFHEKLEEARVASVEKVKQSMNPLPSIPIIEIDADDSNLDDLLKVISETKAGSKQGVSNSDNKSVQQEKEDTPIQKARSESLKMVLLKSAAEKMIRLMNQPLDMLQIDPYWNDELVKVTSCLVEQQFPEKYRV
ncbi:hypothetical protein PIB30_104519, partial [Stylosanthes scabra]|nr:hypothetical protein [Stylosanthes scabra]